jgi:nucleotide-binding universal stress UspA family protein
VDALREEALNKMEPFVKFAQQKHVQATCVIEEGTVASVVLKVAKRYAAVLIIVTPRPHGNWARILFGPTTAEQIIQEAECHVMVVRTPAAKV